MNICFARHTAFAAILVAGPLLASAAQAALLTYEFSGELDEGSAFIGSLSYNTDDTPDFSSPTLHRWDNGVGSYTFTSGTYSGETFTGANVTIFHSKENPGIDEALNFFLAGPFTFQIVLDDAIQTFGDLGLIDPAYTVATGSNVTNPVSTSHQISQFQISLSGDSGASVPLPAPFLLTALPLFGILRANRRK